jgi:hypothetical protein
VLYYFRKKRLYDVVESTQTHERDVRQVNLRNVTVFTRMQSATLTLHPMHKSVLGDKAVRHLLNISAICLYELVALIPKFRF